MTLLTSTSLHSSMASDTPWWMQCSVFDELLDYEPSPSPEGRPAAPRRVQLSGQGGWRNRGRVRTTVAARLAYVPPRPPPRMWQAPPERRRRAQLQTANGSAFWTGAAQAIAAGAGSIGLLPKIMKPQQSAAAPARQPGRRPLALPPSAPQYDATSCTPHRTGSGGDELLVGLNEARGATPPSGIRGLGREEIHGSFPVHTPIILPAWWRV